MKLPNGFGSVYKLIWQTPAAMGGSQTFGWEFDEKGQKVKQKQQAIGYYATRQEAMTALVQYNENPYDLNFNKTTFSEVYEKWSEEYSPHSAMLPAYVQSLLPTSTALLFMICE